MSFWEQLGPELAQAVGMVSAQAECNAAQALDLMTDRARRQDQTLDAITEAVLDRSIRFSE